MSAATKLLESIDHQAVFITGGASGLGLEIAKAFARPNVRLGLLDRNADGLAEAKVALQATGAEVATYRADITDEESMRVAVDDFAAHGLGMMVNNAGVATGGRLMDRPMDDWSRVMSVNVMGTVNGCRAALPHLEEGRSVLLNIASAAGFVSAPMMASYNASKAAVISLSETLYGEYIDCKGLRISVAMPAFFKTNLLSTLEGSEEEKETARLMMDYSGYSAPEAVEDILDAVAAGELYVFAPKKIKTLWRFKRFLPYRFFKALPAKREQQLEKLRKIDRQHKRL